MTRAAWLGHSTVLIDMNGTQVLTDPVLRQGIGPLRRRIGPLETVIEAADAVLISHLHHDHLDLGSLEQLPRSTPIVIPAGGGRLVRARGFTHVIEVRLRDRVEIGGLTITPVRARHGGVRFPLGPSARALGYVIEGDHRVYFAGDTDVFPEMAELASPPLDLAIVPVGGWGPTLRGGHLDAIRAAEALTLLVPRHAFAVHWGTFWPIGLSRVRRDRFEQPGRRFVEAARRVAPEVSVAFLDPGDELVLSGNELLPPANERALPGEEAVPRGSEP
jgi:L-ascorbate metabolism protein UlaG (beta-lactamase superfamily)